MQSLLTTREVQQLLNVDRSTIYRMLADGRLQGVKVGHQWRFRREAVEQLASAAAPGGAQRPDLRPGDLHELIPLPCVQPIQDVFAELAEVGGLTIAADGEPLTQLSNAPRFCQLMLASESGRQACRDSWRQLAERTGPSSGLRPCHAGLCYARVPITVDGRLVGQLLAGQVFTTRGRSFEERKRIAALAAIHGIDTETLTAASREVPVLARSKWGRLVSALRRVAETFEHIALERAEFVRRLRVIAQLSTLKEAEQGEPGALTIDQAHSA